MRDVESIVREVAEGWLERALARAAESLRAPHRVPCALCSSSALAGALGEFSGWPHPLVHPLVRAITDVLEDRSHYRLAGEMQQIRARWRDRTEVGDTGDAPDDDHVLWAAQAQREEIEMVLEVEAEAVAWDDWGAAAALSQFCADRAEIARAVAQRLVDRAVDTFATLEPGSIIDADERRAFFGGLDRIYVAWVVWLPTREWMTLPPVEQGAVCGLCADFPSLDRLDAPHAVRHVLATGIATTVKSHLETYGEPRIEPPAGREFERYLHEFGVLLADWFELTAEGIHRALRSYVLDVVAAGIGAASEHLPVVSDGDGGVASDVTPD